MNRRELETLLLTLESTPVLLERAAAGFCQSTAQRRPAAGGFSLLENVWHLADLEREGFGVRVRRILSEDEPTLSNFDGDRIARERDYRSRDLSTGLTAFREARRRNCEVLRAVSGHQWKRRAFQEELGPMTLADVPRMMAEHDRSHTADVAALLEEISQGKPAASPGQRQTHRVSAFA